jgi:hypothetical protein
VKTIQWSIPPHPTEKAKWNHILLVYQSHSSSLPITFENCRTPRMRDVQNAAILIFVMESARALGGRKDTTVH